MLFHFRSCNKRGQKREHYCRGYSSSGGGEAARKDPQSTLFGYCLNDSFGQRVTEAGKGNGRTRARPFNKGLIQACRPEDNSRQHISDKYPCRCKLCKVDKELTDRAERAAHEKCLKAGNKEFRKDHSLSLFFIFVRINSFVNFLKSKGMMG